MPCEGELSEGGGEREEGGGGEGRKCGGGCGGGGGGGGRWGGGGTQAATTSTAGGGVRVMQMVEWKGGREVECVRQPSFEEKERKKEGKRKEDKSRLVLQAYREREAGKEGGREMERERFCTGERCLYHRPLIRTQSPLSQVSMFF